MFIFRRKNENKPLSKKTQRKTEKGRTKSNEREILFIDDTN